MQNAFSGPQVVYGDRNPLGVGATGSNNPDLAPSLVRGGYALIDNRAGYNVTRKGAIGLGLEYRRVLAATPSVIALTNIAAAAATTSGTKMTLVSATGAGVTVVAAATQVWASGNTVPAGSLALDGLPGVLTYGIADPAGLFKTSLYDNSKAISRAVSVTATNGGAAGGVFTVAGADIYGYPMTEAITHAGGATTAKGKKAFKFVYSVTPGVTDAQTYSVGTTDIFGLPLRATAFPQVFLWWNNALITANTGFVVADTTSPATTTTGDVRGTYAVQSASDGTKVLFAAVAPSESTIVTTAGLFGVTQV